MLPNIVHVIFLTDKMLHSAVANSMTFENQVSRKGVVLMHKVVSYNTDLLFKPMKMQILLYSKNSKNIYIVKIVKITF